MSKNISSLSVAFIAVFIAVLIFTTARQFSRAQDFQACYAVQGQNLILHNNQVFLNDRRIGSFRLERGDATKGPDRILFTSTEPGGPSLGIDTRYVWYPSAEGAVLPGPSGKFWAPICRSAK